MPALLVGLARSRRQEPPRPDEKWETAIVLEKVMWYNKL